MQRLRIAVCDDAPSDLQELKQALLPVFPEAEFLLFETGKQLLESFRNGSGFDLVFLDIYLKNENGLDIGREIRKQSTKTELVYISGSREFGYEALELDALHYLLKPLDQEKLLEVQHRFFRMKNRRASIRLPHLEQEIPLHLMTYIESFHNDIIVHLVSGSTITIRGSLTGFMSYLDERFLRINRGIIVNMEAIEKMKNDSCQIGGMTFMLGRKDRAENRKKYTDWLFESMMERDA